MGASVSETSTQRRNPAASLLIPIAVGAAVSIGLGVYSRVHEPSGYSVNLAGFSSPLAVKTWLTTVALVFAIVQALTAAGMWGKLGLADRPWVAPVHRWSGRIAVFITIPVLVHCLYALGFESASPRVLAHSLLGCFFFGVFVCKMLALTRDDTPGWALPLLGGLTTAVLVAIWLTSALWFFTTFGVTT